MYGLQRNTNQLTPRQLDVYRQIVAHVVDAGRMPTLRELCERLELSSTNAAREHLAALERKGWISRQSETSRSIRLIRGVPHWILRVARLALERYLDEDPYVPGVGLDWRTQSVVALERARACVDADRLELLPDAMARAVEAVSFYLLGCDE